MATLSTRADFEAAQRATDRALRAMFEQMATELAGIVAQAADADGVVPLAKADEVRAKARKAVAAYFVQERVISGSERANELERLHGLIEQAQNAMRGATERERIQLRGRVSLLSKRVALLQKGTALVAFDDRGQGVSAYAKIIQKNATTVIKDVIEKNTVIVRERIADARTKIKS